MCPASRSISRKPAPGSRWDYQKAYSTSFTFESSQNLVGLLPSVVKSISGQEVPFAPYDEATGTYASVPADNTSEATTHSGRPIAAVRGYGRDQL